MSQLYPRSKPDQHWNQTSPAPVQLNSIQFALALGSLCFTLFQFRSGATMISPSLPLIVAEFKSSNMMSWTAYLLTAPAFLPVLGKACYYRWCESNTPVVDTIGGGALVSAFGTSMVMVIVGRAVSGQTLRATMGFHIVTALLFLDSFEEIIRRDNGIITRPSFNGNAREKQGFLAANS
ncbi:hypothetical protein BJ742DRAFT_814731 [Cladochytrium replicatum]|nr:hypothetical protein BJ742DRAFT_814731 [Cladochytrium replicatum]